MMGNMIIITEREIIITEWDVIEGFFVITGKTSHMACTLLIVI